MKKRLLTLFLCFVMLISCLGAGIDAVTEESGTVPFADETPVADVPSAPVDDITGGAEPTLSLYEKLMSAETEEEFEAIAQAADEDELAALSEEELAALKEHYGEIYVPVIPETVVFTDAGPFLPAVNVAPSVRMRLMARAAAAETPKNGLVTSKSATPNNDGSYTIKIEAYATGTVTTETSTKPVDIVLVLDQSGSMADDFNGNSPDKDKDRRQYAMKEAVNNFISAVNAKYNAEKSDHRMAIVTFGSNASVKQGWTFVDEAGKNTLQGEINKLPPSPSGATNVAAGMSNAETLMGSGHAYNGTNTNRHKVVIVFTDGVPTTSSDFDTNVATSAIASAKVMKDDGVTVYSVGIFTGAKPSELYGASGFDKNSDGTVGSNWSDFSIWNIGDIKAYDVPAGNRFLNYLSSNFANTTNIGIKNYKSTFFGVGYRGWEITQNFDRTASGYYLTANDSTSLNTIFETISNNIGNTPVTLNSSAVVKDTVTEYFNMPADTSAVSVKTYDCTSYNTATGAAVWSSNGTALNNAVSIDQANNAVNVTGFDFAKNFVAENGRDENDVNKTGSFHGRKLVIEFTVTPKAGFLGGNDVPTNGSDSGIYESASAEKPVGNFKVPTVNVPIAQPDVSVKNKTVYEGGSTAASGLYNAQSLTWQADYVDVVYAIDGKPVSGDLSPADCTDYEVSLTYKPKTDGSASQGTPNSMDGVTDTKTATIHVLKPAVSVTMNDTVKFYGESCTPGDGNNISGTVEWKDAEHAAIPAAEGTAPYTAGDLVFTYDKGEFTVPKSDTEINVTVKEKGTDITDKTAFTVSCTDGCDVRSEGKYIVHAKTCSLTVQKQGGTDGEPYVFSIMKDGKYYTSVTVIGNGAVTVKELPVGIYSIAEDMNWAWRFAESNLDKGSVTLGADNVSDTIICTNSGRSDSWLNGFSNVIKNVFGNSPVFRAVL